jgi:DNA-binding NarL/FixJ family response regulator
MTTPQHAHTTNGQTPAEPPSALTILIVDDHPVFREEAREMLEGAGYNVVGEEGTAAGAITHARELDPDIVLLDVQLPDGDGFSTAATMAAQPNAPRVVLVSSREQEDYGSRITKAPIAGFIHKPELTQASLEQVLNGPA